MTPVERSGERRRLGRMRVVSLIEGTTLILLLGVAVPLKHLFGLPVAVRVMGPVHGLAFVLYVQMLVQTLAGGGWSRSESGRMIVAAFIPFGAFANERLLARRARRLR